MMPKTAPFSFLLDTYSGAAVAYSLRKLRSAYSGNCIRVRRSSDNTEQDFGFVNNVLDTASLLTFVGAGNGFVTTWYDQSGNANNATMSTAINQPQIVQSGNVLTVNSKPSISLDGGLQYLNLSSSITAGASSFNTFVGKRDVSGRRLFGLAGGNNQQYLLCLWTDNNYYLQAITNTFQSSTATDTSTNQLLLTGQNSAGTMSIYKNNNVITSTQGTFIYSPVIGAIGFYFNAPILAYCNLQEIVFYNSNQSSNRTGINTNINTFYSIY